MCGIAGLLGGEVGEASLRAACEAMTHRGPDAATTWREPGRGFAHTRLSIIDVAGGAQPMFTEDDRFGVVFNGEIYNHRVLRRDLERDGVRFRTNSDTEVLLHLYARDGAAMVASLHGMFAFAVVDRLRDRALLARDRFGKKPLCYLERGGLLAFASTLDALRPLLPATPEVDLDAIARYLVLQYVPAPLTAWRGVRKLPPGHLAEWVDGRLDVRSYWSPPERERAEPIDRREAALRLRELVRESVTSRLESEVPLGVFLSGGLDSSVVVAELAASGARPATYSVGFSQPELDETRYARLVADRFGTDHHQLLADDDDVSGLWEEFTHAYDEPFADSSALATLAVSRAARQRVTVILTGDGGDELFGGYGRYAAYRTARRLNHRLGPFVRPAALAARVGGRVTGNAKLRFGGDWVRDPWASYRDALFHFAPAELPGLLHPEALNGSEARASAAALDDLWRTAPDRASTLLWIDERTYLPDDLLVKMDRATMAHSLEARSPLLDHRLAAFASDLPEEFLFREGGVGKMIVREAYGDVLPAEILTRDKRGFVVPMAEWLRTKLRPQVEDLLLTDDGPLWSWVRPERVRPLVRRVLGGDDQARRKVWNLLALAGWADARRIS